MSEDFTIPLYLTLHTTYINIKKKRQVMQQITDMQNKIIIISN